MHIGTTRFLIMLILCLCFPALSTTSSWWRSNDRLICSSGELITGSLCLFRNRAIADYLRSNGYEEAYSTFKKEAELDNVSRLRVDTHIRTANHTNLDQQYALISTLFLISVNMFMSVTGWHLHPIMVVCLIRGSVLHAPANYSGKKSFYPLGLTCTVSLWHVCKSYGGKRNRNCWV